jgi:molybdopterin molybdotransferase
LSDPHQNSRAASADEVIALLNRVAQPLATERVTLENAAGRILREPVCAPEDQPAFDRSAVDGFVVRLDDTSSEFQIVDEIRAGDWKPRPLQRGETIRISTGGALPGEQLQVVMKEDVQVSGKNIRVPQRSPSGNIRFRGEDARAGQVLIEPGVKLQSGTLALLASVGQANPLVTRVPRVLHLATGNEIVPPEQTPARGQIRDSNSILVRSFLQRWKLVPEQIRLPEDEQVAKSAIGNRQSAIAELDLLLISGGASVGEHDFTHRLLEHFGFEILVSKTTLRPGKPLIVARRGSQLAFGLPGNPLAHFVCLNLFIRVALERLSGGSPKPLFHSGTLAAKLEAGRNGRETFWPAQLAWRTGALQLTPLPWSSSGDLTSLATANALVRVPANCADLNTGTAVEFVPTNF